MSEEKKTAPSTNIPLLLYRKSEQKPVTEQVAHKVSATKILLKNYIRENQFFLHLFMVFCEFGMREELKPT